MMRMDCGSKMRRTTEPITEAYKGCSLTVSGIEHYACDACGEYEIGAAEAGSLSRALLAKYAGERDLLPPRDVAISGFFGKVGPCLSGVLLRTPSQKATS